MTMKPVMLSALLLVLSSTGLIAQDKNNEGQPGLSIHEFNLPASPAIDSSASAVILSDSGKIRFEGSRIGRFVSYVYTKKTTVKLLRNQGFDAATVKILLYGKDELKDKLENVQAVTYNMENGKIVATPLKKEDIFENKLGKYTSEVKFTMPGLREGAVIEYSYRIVSSHYYSLPSWRFQHIGIPCLKSNFEISTPDFLRYVVVQNGADSLAFTTSEDGYNKIYIYNVSVSSGYHKLKWSTRNIASFKTQGYIYNRYDYLDAISFHFVSTNYTADKGSIPTWQSATNDLLSNPDFGGVIAEGQTDNLSHVVERVTASDDNLLKAAKSIYAYVRDNFSCINDNDIYVNTDLYEVNKKRKGNTAELNLLLVGLLRQKGLKADPVILGTREFGVHPVTYPALDKMNYVIARLKIFGDTVYLDASHPQLGFGKLPLNCYNGHGRIISATDTGNVYLFPEAVKELERTTVFIKNEETENGAMTGNLQSVPAYHHAYALRQELDKQSLNDFFKKINIESIPGFTIENPGIDSLTRYDDPIGIHYDFHFKTSAENELIYFNPMLTEGLTSNPFTAAEREYPVEMPAPVDKLYVLNMEIPAGYTVEEMPASAKFVFNGNEGSFEYRIQKDDMGIQLRSRLKMDRAVFRPEEYNELREFFAQVVKKQAELVVFKRKK